MLIEARRERLAWRKLKTKKNSEGAYLEALSIEANSVLDLGYQQTIPLLQWLLQLRRKSNYVLCMSEETGK